MIAIFFMKWIIWFCAWSGDAPQKLWNINAARPVNRKSARSSPTCLQSQHQHDAASQFDDDRTIAANWAAAVLAGDVADRAFETGIFPNPANTKIRAIRMRPANGP